MNEVPKMCVVRIALAALLFVWFAPGIHFKKRLTIYIPRNHAGYSDFGRNIRS